MGRSRVIEYVDVYVSSKELLKLRKGYTIRKQSNGQHICLKHSDKDRKTQRQIDKLKQRIKELEAK